MTNTKTKHNRKALIRTEFRIASIIVTFLFFAFFFFGLGFINLFLSIVLAFFLTIVIDTLAMTLTRASYEREKKEREK